MTTPDTPTPDTPTPTSTATAPVRAEDAIDVAAVAAWIRENCADSEVTHDLDLGSDQAPVFPEVRQFTSGASNLTYLLSYPGGELVLRRPPAGTKARGAHDMRREYELQAALYPVWPKVPRMVGYCADEAVTGSPFYVMERLRGPVCGRDLPPEVDLDLLGVRRLGENMVEALVELHSVDVSALGLDWLDRGEGYVRRQVEGWSRRYRDARTPDVPDFERVMAWLAAHQPPDGGHCLVHNDFRLDNVVLDPEDNSRIVGVLDWELATVGDPMTDLGCAMAYWVEGQDGRALRALRRQPSHLMGMPTRREFVFRYLDGVGAATTPERWSFYHVFGLFRLAVIAQQIHFRYFHGQTTNPAFRHFRLAVVLLEQQCFRAMRMGGRYRAVSMFAASRAGREQDSRLVVALVAGRDAAHALRPLAVGAGFGLWRRSRRLLRRRR